VARAGPQRLAADGADRGAVGLGHYCIIHAFQRAPASLLAPFTFTQLLWATLLGYGVFGDLPDGWTLAGALIIVASGLYVFYRESVLRGDAGA